MVQLPFFAIAHLVTLASGYPTDGYSAFYLIFVQVATLFYALAGLVLMILILKDFQINDKIIALILLASVFGTNLFHYVVNEPSMSHAYSFAFVNFFVFCFLRFLRKPSNRYLLAGSAALGIIFLIRPVNVLIVVSLPFLAGSPEKLKEGFNFLKDHLPAFLIASVTFFGLVFIQLLIYKIQTGNFWVYSYGKEGFDFTHPHIIKFLISYRKGYFVYTPMAFLSLFGFWFLYKESKFRFYSLLFFLLLVVFVLMIVCQIQTFQYRTGYIHWSEMNRERYWDNFLRIDKVIRREEKEW